MKIVDVSRGWRKKKDLACYGMWVCVESYNKKTRMRKIYLILFVVLIQPLHGQNFKEKDVRTKINDVTVFLSGAQIFETALVTIPAGKTILTIKDLSPYVDEKSIQVKADGEFTILSVNHKFNYLNDPSRDVKIDSLKKVLDESELAVIKDEARLDILKEKQSLLDKNKNLGGETSGATIAQLKQAMDFYEAELSRIREEEIRIGRAIAAKKNNQEKVTKQLKELNEQSSLPTSEIEVRVSAENQLTTKLNLTYLVANAGWYPKYDIRVQDINSPLELTYKAEVYQNTGVDWKDVKLRFSNGDPNQSGQIPTLAPWVMTYARNTSYGAAIYGSRASQWSGNVRGKVLSQDGSPLPGVNVLIKGTTIGTVTDMAGNYSLVLPSNSSPLVFSFIGMKSKELNVTGSEMNVVLEEDATMLQEVMTTGYGYQGAGLRIRGTSSVKPKLVPSNIIVTRVVENQTTVEIEVQTPYSIKSNGEKLQVDLRKHQINALYEYYAVPKLDKDAFLIAKIINWDQYNLLEGEANLYFEDAFVGRSVLNAKSLEDTLDISLGRDKNIVIGRQRNEQLTTRRTLGLNVVEIRGYKITVRNKKSQSIKLTVFDHLPVPIVSDITVNHTELSNGQLEEKTGKITWEITLEPQKQKEIDLQFEVKYPKREKVLLE